MNENDKPTVFLDPRSIKPNWPITIASLEMLGPWTTRALRIGIAALVDECSKLLANGDKPAAPVIVRLRELTEALAHLPSEK